MFLSILVTIATVVPAVGGAEPAERARANLGSYFSTDDYPMSAVMRGVEGTVRFELEIAPDGHVSRCNVTGSSGDASLDTATCAILLGRARYRPARDAEGRATVGIDRGSVTWRLPTSPGLPFERVVTINRLRWNGAGQLNCAVTINGVAVTDVGPNDCGNLVGTDMSSLLRLAPAQTEFISIYGIGPAGEGIDDVAAEEAGYGVLRYDLVADLNVGPDGRITQCRVSRRNIPSPGLAVNLPDLCEFMAPGTPPLFEATADAAPRRAQHRVAYYINGWAVDAEAPLSAPQPPIP